MEFDSSSYTLDECLSQVIDYRGKTPHKTAFGVPLITAKIVKAGRIERAEEFIATDYFDRWMTRGLPQCGDVVLTTEAPLGEVGQIKKLPVALAQRVVTLRGKPGLLDNTYLLYALQTEPLRSRLIGRATGTTVVGIKQSELRKVTVALPPIEIQRDISRVLASLDDRIDHNCVLATTLEAIARQLFKSWFVDFDPVRAKAAGEKPTGLANDIAELFPDRFEESESGDVPGDWNVGKISDFSTNVRVGCAPSLFTAADFYVGLEHFDRRCLTLWNGGSGDDATSNKSRFAKGDLLFGKLRPYFHKVAVAPMDGICSTDVLVIRCADKAYREFMYFALFQDDVIQFVSDASGGTRMPRTNWETLAGYDCVVPPKSLSSVFGEIVAPMIETMMQCVAENSALTKLRDLLLPRLISGKLRVDDAESIIEEAIA